MMHGNEVLPVKHATHLTHSDLRNPLRPTQPTQISHPLDMHSIFSEFLSKVANIRINEFLHSRQEIDLEELGKVYDADQSFRDHLKTYGNNLRRT